MKGDCLNVFSLNAWNWQKRALLSALLLFRSYYQTLILFGRKQGGKGEEGKLKGTEAGRRKIGPIRTIAGDGLAPQWCCLSSSLLYDMIVRDC